jgi:hypothetical protein
MDLSTRPFRYSDPEALELSGTMRLQFLEDMALFEDYDPALDSGFATAWEAAIKACFDHDSHELMQERLGEYTLVLEGAVAQGSAAMADLRYFAQLAFGKTPQLAVFQFGQHDHVRRRTMAYPIYLRVQHGLALDHAAQLTAKGMTPAQIAALDAAATAITDAELVQERFKREILQATIQRNDLYSTMWGFPQAVNAAADVIFAAQPTKRGLYRLG